jgi:outer membrane receptor for ferrienterochelin and colicins
MRFRTSFGRILLACGLACVLHPGTAGAQAVDYGTLEQMFGEPITTSATGKPQRASDVPADMVIITQDDIRRSGADNIPDILQFVAGIDMRRYSFGDAEIAVRGYDSLVNPRLLVLVDGRQVYSDDYGYVAWNTIPVQLSEIRQIEVVRGPNTALFGFNAASGVINIITYDPLLDNRNTATVRGGTQGYGEGEAVATQHFGATAGVRVSVGGWTATNFAQPDPVSTPPSRDASFNVDGRWQVAPNLLLSASGGMTDAQAERNLIIDADNRTQLNYGRIMAAAPTALGTIDLDVYRNKTANNYVGLAADTDVVDVVRLSDLLRLDVSNVIRAGLEYRNNSGTPDIGPPASYGDYAANFMWDWQISPSMELTNAVRADDLVLHYGSLLSQAPERPPDTFQSRLSAVSFNSGLVIHLTDRDMVRIMLSRGLQLPSLTDFGVDVSLFGLTLLGSPQLAPESVWNAELAYDRTLQRLGATFTGSIFLQRNTDLLAAPGNTTLEVVDGRPTEVAANVGSSNELGVEIGLASAQNSEFRWKVSYRYTAIVDDIMHGVAETAVTSYDTGTPSHVVIVGAGYTRGRWEVDMQARGQTKYLDFEDLATKQIVPGYVSFNARVGFHATDYLTLAGTAEQFNVSRLLEGAGSYVDRHFIASATLRY